MDQETAEKRSVNAQLTRVSHGEISPIDTDSAITLRALVRVYGFRRVANAMADIAEAVAPDGVATRRNIGILRSMAVTLYD